MSSILHRQEHSWELTSQAEATRVNEQCRYLTSAELVGYLQGNKQKGETSLRGLGHTRTQLADGGNTQQTNSIA